LISGGLLVLVVVVLLASGVRLLPDERYSWEAQARRLKACNDRLEALAVRAPAPEEMEALDGLGEGAGPSPEVVAWVDELRACLEEARGIGEDVSKTKYELSSSRLELQKELDRFTRILRDLLPGLDWDRIERRAWMRESRYR